MNRLSVCILLAAALLTGAAQAQDLQKPEAKPAATGAAQEPAANPEPGPGQEPDPRIPEGILRCLAEGLPQDWKKAWFVIVETARSRDGATRSYAADFFFATNANDRKGKPLKPCGPEKILEGVGALNDYLPDGQRRWTSATFTFLSDGKYEAKYDYTPRKPAPSKPATKKKQEASK